MFILFLPFTLPYVIIKKLLEFNNTRQAKVRPFESKYTGVETLRKDKAPVTITNKKVTPKTIKWRDICRKEFIAIDIETTGLEADRDRIIEIAAVKYADLRESDRFCTLINPGIRIPRFITEINGITNDMVKDAPTIKEVLPRFIEFIGNSVLVAHNARFDLGFLNHNAWRLGYKSDNPYIDTLSLCRNVFPGFCNYKLGTVAENLGIDLRNAHRALADTRAVGQILVKCINRLDETDK